MRVALEQLVVGRVDAVRSEDLAHRGEQAALPVDERAVAVERQDVEGVEVEGHASEPSIARWSHGRLRGNPGILRPMRPPRWLIEVVETLGLTLITFVVIQSFVAQPFQVRQTSMERTLEPDEYVLVDKLTTRFDPFHRGDIVVLHPPEGWADEQGTPFIKRVIGLPGETVAIGDDGGVTVNGGGARRGRLHVQGRRRRERADDAAVGRGDLDAGPGELFVMGDHREASADSRSFGPVKEASIVGRAFLRYWPASTFGILSRPAYP